MLYRKWKIGFCSVVVFVIILGCVINFVILKPTSTLQLVSVVFRHGDRTHRGPYKSDPYFNEIYYPYGFGQLTTVGKKTMYKVGKQLRFKYGDFLGDVYYPEMLRALTSQFPRTRMSMQLVLAALFPPSKQYEIEPGLNWQPVDYEHIKFEEDDMIAFWGKCTEYVPNTSKIFHSQHADEMDAKFKSVYDYINKNTGDNLTTFFDACWYNEIFKAQEGYGLKLPEWTKSIYPTPLDLIYKEYWIAIVSSHKGIKYTSGRLLEKIGKDYTEKTLKESARKLYLYAGHDYSITGLLAAFNITHNFSLQFGSYIAIELHKIEEEYFVQIYHQDHSTDFPLLKSIEGCDELCPLNTFIKLTEIYYANPDICDN